GGGDRCAVGPAPGLEGTAGDAAGVRAADRARGAGCGAADRRLAGGGAERDPDPGRRGGRAAAAVAVAGAADPGGRAGRAGGAAVRAVRAGLAGGGGGSAAAGGGGGGFAARCAVGHRAVPAFGQLRGGAVLAGEGR